MTRDEVLALAREVGLWEMLEGYSSEYGSLDAEEDCLPTLERFVSLAKAHEREECAKLCDAQAGGRRALEHYAALTYSGAANDCAGAIRNRK